MFSANTQKKALFIGGNAPPGGLCLSSFVVVRSDSKILVGKIAKPEIWIERFFMGAEFAPTYAASGKYVIPASHLAWYESPVDAAERILREQVAYPIPKNKIRFNGAQSHLSGDGSGEEPPHWDICFVYETKFPSTVAKRLKTPEWFAELTFVDRNKLHCDDFTRGHGDILKEAGAIGRKTRRTK